MEKPLPGEAAKTSLETGNERPSAVFQENLEPIPTADLPTRLAEEVSYGPGGMRGILSSPYVFGAAFLASLGGFSFGYDQGVISIINVMPQFHAQFPETADGGFYTGFMTAMLEFGAFIGCFFMPWLADRVSRKWALSIVVVIFNIGGIIQTSAPNYAALVIGRTIGGIGVGTMAMGAPLYISEIAPPQLRGALLVLESISIVAGVVIAYWITYATKDLAGEIAFRLPFGLQMVSATLLGIAIHIFPYSPRWLAMAARPADTLTALAQLRRLPASDARVQTEYAGILAEVAFQRLMLEKHHPGTRGLRLELATWLDLLARKNWRRTAVGVGVAFFQQFSGINGFIYYAPILFRSLGQSDVHRSRV
ncbi:putative high-affinity glucose transporter [Mytilinidion resinicola]|uniref:High-affinity glucose transporter n=1 Tax=Mytilinidion resinicola TaxID=574789 RepID=A0A6A6XYL6_9PEZI|nr:putative high-affinity glucose transporter [Mytilinidion resinicola]KAF2801656.1 putative high-affinity glucose transporter [Mytilinidion resinicola]